MAEDLDRETILEDFRACTGIEDAVEAFHHLEHAKWDLLDAINRAVPQDSQTLPSERTNSTDRVVDARMEQDPSDNDTSRMDDEDDDVYYQRSEDNIVPNPLSLQNQTKESYMSSIRNQKSNNSSSKVIISTDYLQRPSSSKNGEPKNGKIASTQNSQIHFKISYGNQTVGFELDACETTLTLKTLIHAHFEVPPCEQILSGWPQREPRDQEKFQSLKLPRQVSLRLSTDLPVFQNHGNEDRCNLKIRDESKDLQHELYFSMSTTVRNVKDHVYDLTDIPVRNQVWTGWPGGVADDMTLEQLKLPPNHQLCVKSKASESASNVSYELNKTINMSGEGSETSSDIEDLTESYPLEDDYFVPEEKPKPQKYLIPETVADEAVGTVVFFDNFALRYGHCHPMFFHGTLEEAVKESCNLPARDRKLLAVYLHHDGSVVTNVFCQQVLCNESIVSYLSNNFIVWGWDVTVEANRQMLIASVSKSFGPGGVQTVRSLNRDRYPVLIIVSRTRGTIDITSVISGSGTVDELMGSLMHAYDMFQSQQKVEIKDEEEREARERVKREQDEAYEASLMADRAKEEAKRALEQRKIDEENQQKLNELELQQRREAVAQTLPPEPASDSDVPTCSLKCRLPAGKVISRKFVKTQSLRILFDYLFSQGYGMEEYRFLTSYPKRDLTTMPDTTLFGDIFSAQDTLIVESR